MLSSKQALLAVGLLAVGCSVGPRGTEHNLSADVATSCTGGETSCGSACVDLKRDSQNCGTCGSACSAEQICAEGLCKTSPFVVSCTDPGYSLCNKTCVKTSDDPNNCGACGNRCATDFLCNNGHCDPNCGGSKTACPSSQPTYQAVEKVALRLFAAC